MRLSSPSLVAVALVAGFAARLGAASEAEARFEAVRALIESELRAPAERKFAEFVAAGYDGAAWYRRFLEWDFAERFHTVPPERAEAMAAEIAAALEQDPSLPRAVREAFAARGSPLLRAVNELARVVDPDAPGTLAAADIPATERAYRDQLVARVIALATAEWKRAEAQVAQFEAKEEPAQFDLPGTDPRVKALMIKGALLREEAARPLALAHIVLREVVTRGKDFGLDPAPAQAFFGSVLAQAKERLSAWDYGSGDDYLPLKAACNEVLAEAVRERLPGITADEVAGELEKVIYADLRPYPDAVRGSLVELQLATCASLMRWRLELGDQYQLRAGLDTWQALQDRMKAERLTMSGDDAKARTLAQAAIIAARLQAARHDVTAACATLATVAACRDNPLAQRARMWIASFTMARPSDGWADPPRPADPAEVLTVAKVLMGQAQATADPRWQRTLYLRAAVALRSGLLGLGAEADPDRFVALAPEVYATYAAALERLGLHVHAALASEEGLRAIAARVNAKQHPLHVDGDPAKPWTDFGTGVQRLARAALSDAAALASQAQQAGMPSAAIQSVYADTVALTQKIDAKLVTDSADKIRIDVTIGSDPEGAIPLLRAFAERNQGNPDDAAWAFAKLCEARTAAYDALEQRLPTEPSVAAPMEKLAQDLLTSCAEAAAPLDVALKQGRELTPQERRIYGIAKTGPIAMDLRRGRCAEVVAALEGGFFDLPLGDQALTARMLKMLCLALKRQQEPTLAKADAATLLAAWPAQRVAYDLLRDHGARFTDEAALRSVRQAAQTLAVVCNNLVNAGAPLLKSHAPHADELPLDEARKLTADLIYPDLDAGSRPDLLLSIGALLWEGGDHARGGKLYEWYLKVADGDEQVRAFQADPRARLAEVEAVAAARPELKAEWAKIRELWSDDHAGVDYAKAASELRRYRTLLESEKTLLGADGLAKMLAALAPLQKTVLTLAQRLEVERALAAWYRETHRTAESRALYQQLIAAEPDDPEVAAAFIDGVLDDAHGAGVPEAQLRQARELAIGIRAQHEDDPRLFWPLQVGILELSAQLHEIEAIDRALKSLRLRGDLSQDLVQPPVRADARIAGDDLRARRAKDAEAVALARRYLELHRLQGVRQPLPFRIQEVVVGERTWTLFVDAGAPDMVGTAVTNAEGDPVVVFRPAGDSALK